MNGHFPPPKPTTLTADILRSAELEELEMRVVAGESGFGRPISWGRIQRPGLALAGFLPYIKPGRIQILGESELNYLDTMPEDVRRERIASICALPVAAFVITKGQQPPEDIVRECRLRKIPLLVSDRNDLGRHPVDHARPRGRARALDHAARRPRRRLRDGRPAARASRASARASALSTSCTAATASSPTTRSRSAGTRAARSSAARRR